MVQQMVQKPLAGPNKWADRIWPQRFNANVSWQRQQSLQVRADFEGRSISNMGCHLMEVGSA